MKKALKKVMIITFCSFIFLLFMNSKNVEASESTAAYKGFSTNNLEYISDEVVEDKRIYGSNFYYGRVSMWAATYKTIVLEEDNRSSCYYFIFVESSIESRGKAKIGWIKNYFRNKYLTINVSLKSNKVVNLIDYTTSDNGASASTTKSFGFGAEGSAGADGANVGVNCSYTISNTATYNAVCLTSKKSSSDDNKEKYFTFEYYFKNWKNGAMHAPNIGLVRERVALVYQIEDYRASDNCSINIETTATIFKDVKTGVNSTKSGSINFAGDNGNLESV